MNEDVESMGFFARIFGTIVIAGIAYLGLSYISWWDLEGPIIPLVSASCGFLFFFLGKNLKSWMHEVFFWS